MPRQKKEVVVEKPVTNIDMVLNTASVLMSQLEDIYRLQPKAEIGSAINATDVLIRSLKASLK